MAFNIDTVITFRANLKHDIRNNQAVEVGSGVFVGQELVDVLAALDAALQLPQQGEGSCDTFTR